MHMCTCMCVCACVYVCTYVCVFAPVSMCARVHVRVHSRALRDVDTLSGRKMGGAVILVASSHTAGCRQPCLLNWTWRPHPVPVWEVWWDKDHPAVIAFLSRFISTSPESSPASALKSWFLQALPQPRLSFTFAMRANGT